MKALAIGASRNIGYFACLDLLKAGNTVNYQLRNVSAFDDDTEMQPFIKSGQTKLIKGDALDEESVRTTWTEANADGVPVDVVLLSVGTPSSSQRSSQIQPHQRHRYKPSKPLHELNLLCVIPHDATQPRIVAVTSNGVKAESHKKIPFLAKGFYALISVPHADKLGMERAFHWSAGWPEEEWKEGEPEEHILPQGWQERLGGQPGWLKHFVIVRPAILTDGEVTANYKAGEDLPGLWTISRKDIAHFITDDVLKDWSKWEGKAVSVGH